ncbi:MAG: EamA family transporter [Burkholderiales bacterium]|nr:DMT family transporter [Limnohabitans sp.]
MKFPVLPVAALMVSLVTLCAGTSLAKGLFPFVGAEGTTTYRLVFSTLLLMAFWRPWRRAWTWADVPILVLFGATLGLMNLLFYNAIKTVPFGLAIAVEFTGPLAVALWSSKKPLDFVWIVLAVAGMGLILPLGNASGADMQAAAIDPVGIAYALGAGACWAVYIVVGQRVADRIGAFATPMGMLVAALLVTPVGISVAGSSLLNPEWMLAGLGIALLSSAIPYSLEMYSLKHLPKQTFSILLSLEPAVGALAGWLVLSEQLSTQQLGAIGLIMAASMGSAMTAGQRTIAD